MLTRRRLEPGIECKQIAKCGGGGGGGSSAIWLLLGHQLDALILSSLTPTHHHPHQPLQISQKGMRRRRRRNDGGPPIVTIFTLGQHNPLDITNTCAHIYIHKAIESQSLWPSPIWVSHTQRVAHWILKVFAHKELPIRLLRVLHTKNYPSDIWGNLALDESPKEEGLNECGFQWIPNDGFSFLLFLHHFCTIAIPLLLTTT